jgi:hypothetical protein
MITMWQAFLILAGLLGLWLLWDLRPSKHRQREGDRLWREERERTTPPPPDPETYKERLEYITKPLTPNDPEYWHRR